jgi:hypothetical protein
VESDHFDDVSFRVIEDPESAPSPRRRGRRRAVVASVLLVAGAVATSATALATTDDGTSATPAAKPSFIGDKQFRHHGGCHHGDGRRSQQDSSVRY